MRSLPTSPPEARLPLGLVSSVLRPPASDSAWCEFLRAPFAYVAPATFLPVTRFFVPPRVVPYRESAITRPGLSLCTKPLCTFSCTFCALTSWVHMQGRRDLTFRQAAEAVSTVTVHVTPRAELRESSGGSVSLQMRGYVSPRRGHHSGTRSPITPWF